MSKRQLYSLERRGVSRILAKKTAYTMARKYIKLRMELHKKGYSVLNDETMQYYELWDENFRMLLDEMKLNERWKTE